MRTTPVAISAPALPLADPVDRATYTARKLEHLRWEKENLAPGALALAQVALDNALDAYANAVTVAANTATVAANTALAAGYAGATAWVSGTTYAIGNLRYSLANGRVYRRLTAGAGTTDPASDTTNWAIVALNAPAQLVTTAVHQAISGQCLALANITAQGAATNSLLYSDQLDNAAWTKGEVTTTANLDPAPDGRITAEKVVETTANSTHYLIQHVTSPANVARTLSFCARVGGRTSLVAVMDRDGLGTDQVYATYNLITGTVSAVTNAGTASGAAATMTYVGAGHYRCTLSGTPSATAGTTVRSLIYLNTGSAYTGDGVSGIYFTQMQNELGSVATSYIPTTSAPVTRPAGVIAPQRVVLPLTPAANDYVRVVIANGIGTNEIAANTNPLETLQWYDVLSLDKTSGAVDLQYINSAWRITNG